jgi:hypothetical protein
LSNGRIVVKDNWEGSAMACFKVKFWYLHGWFEENHKKIPVRIAGLWVKN